MKLDRNINPDGIGKYALILNRKLIHSLASSDGRAILDAIALLVKHGILDAGDTPDTEFFVMRLKDKYAAPALHTYADEAYHDGEEEYARDIFELASISANHPNRKRPN